MHLRRVVPLALALLFLRTISGCEQEEAPTPSQPPAEGEVGAACTDSGHCKAGGCLTDVSFKEGYCYKDCKTDGACPDGATCHDYLNYKWCFDACEADSACRDGYVCDYGVCRPKCTRGQFCKSGDVCRDGRCKPPCKSDPDCGGDQRCQDGKCLPPCKTEDQCLPGFTCKPETGKCVAKPGKPLGQACRGDGECATGYCLPTRRICSVKCAGSEVCPGGYVCGLEKLDADRNNAFDGAEADCIPVAGKGVAGGACAKDGDCASSHCYYGFCMEGCAEAKNCQGLACMPVNLILDGATPPYRGCLPHAAVGTYTLGAFKAGEVKGFDLPPHATSFVLTTEVGSASEAGLVARLADPTGNVLVEPTGDSCKFYSSATRYYPAEQVANLYYPNVPTLKITPGIHTYQVVATKMDLPVTVKLTTKLGTAQKGTLNINWFFLNLQGTCIPGPTLNAATAATHAWFRTVGTNMRSILKNAGLTIGYETFHDLNSPALDVIEVPEQGQPRELQSLFASSRALALPSLNIFFVREIKSTTLGGMVLGISGGIPGPPGIHGTASSGIAMSMQTACLEKNSSYNPAHTLAHEIGHYLGLFHNQENIVNPGYDKDAKKVVCPCPCGPNLSCQYDIGASWCRGLDPLPDTDTSDKNLMFFAAESTEMFQGNQLSPQQIRVILNSPLAGF
ncbi:MAG: hypothetical protein IT371_10970 [Deltaproteobacteria bacterium]|nr:hypothetical protein [Deltaproteobacteria bacterium]